MEADDAPTPPTAVDVAHRVLCLASLIMRGQIEVSLAEAQPDADDAPQAFDNLTRFIRTSRLAEWYSMEESRLVNQKIGTWKQKNWINAIWRAESAVCLAWALSKVEIPPYDTVVELGELAQAIPLLNTPKLVCAFLEESELRDFDEIEYAREIAEAWNWRSRTHGLSQGAYGNDRKDESDWNKIACESARSWAQEGAFETIGGDFPAFGKPYRDVTRDEFIPLRSIAQERHYAMNWLCGYSSNWDEVPTDT